MARRHAGGATRSRPGGPCRAVWLRVGRLVHRVPRARLAATERAPHPGDVPRTYLSSGFHGTVQSATTCRKTPRVLQPACRRRRADLPDEASSTAAQCRAFEGSCIACPLARASRRDCRRLPGVARSPAGSSSVRTKPSRIHQPRAVRLLRAIGSQAIGHQRHRTGSGH